MKTIVKRNLPLDVIYVMTDKKYVPLNDGYGCTCANCGKPIANIATVRDSEGATYDIGFDCLETILINNNLLSAGDVAQYEAVKRMIPKILRFSKHLKETIALNKAECAGRINGVVNTNRVTGLLFERPRYKSDWFAFYWLHNDKTTSRDNSSVKFKDMEFDFLVETVKNIFPKLTVIVK